MRRLFSFILNVGAWHRSSPHTLSVKLDKPNVYVRSLQGSRLRPPPGGSRWPISEHFRLQ